MSKVTYFLGEKMTKDDCSKCDIKGCDEKFKVGVQLELSSKRRHEVILTQLCWKHAHQIEKWFRKKTK